MKVAILQPGYFPWLGFFDQVYRCDIFIIYDNVQYTKHDWRNRNRIKTPNGVTWLTVPVKKNNVIEKLIKDVEIDNTQQWQKKHQKSLECCYKKAKYFNEVMEYVNEIFKKEYRFLIDIDMDFIRKVHRYLSLDTEILLSSDIPSTGSKDDRILSICKFLNATHYLSGNAAKNYLRESIFITEEITVEWHNYQHPYYTQLWLKEQGFISHLSIIDLLFNYGPDSFSILTGQKIIPQPEEIKIKHADDFKKLE